MNADRLRALDGRLDGTGKQREPIEQLRQQANELSEAAGSRQAQQG